MSEQTENKMGILPVNRLLISMSLPMMLSMLVQALYNVVDSVFVSRVGEDALTAVSLAFPIQNLMIAVSAGTGVGINALLSRCLGERKFDEADKAANNGIFLAFMSMIVFLLFGIFLSRWFFEIQHVDQKILEYGSSYTAIVTIASIGLFGQVTFDRLLQSTGKTFYTMITQGIGAIINIILDPIMIFGLFGCPEFGVAGAALATVIGQIVALLVSIYFNLTKNKEIHISIKNFRPDGNTIRKIYLVGVPSIIMMAISSVMTFCINKILLVFSSTATAVFGVYFKLQSFVFMPVFGLNNGMVPIVSFNYGARKKERVVKTIKLSVIYAVSIMLVGLAIFQLIPDQLLLFFNASEDMFRIGVPALRIISLSFIFAGFGIITCSVFQALGNGFFSLGVSCIRQLIVLVPCAYLLSFLGNVNYVWLAFPIAEIASVILCILFMHHTYKKVIAPMNEKN
ncbi:MAG: MATE family efflux transporter [Clostridiales bacterium]|nr:MATE family efflux transporter [Clostridiales bacterium]